MSHPKLRYLSDGHLGMLAAVNHDIVANPAPLAIAGARVLRDHGGPKIPRPKLYLVMLGDWWGDTSRLEAFAHDLMTAGYLQPLADLGHGTGQGTYEGLIQLRPQLAPVMKDSDVRKLLKDAIAAGELPPADENTMYALVFPDSVTVVFDGDASGSCASWCGYHSNDVLPDGTPVIYSVQTQTECGPCNGGHPPFDAFCMVLAHEVVEMCTDPTAGGWYDDSDGSEDADIEAWIALTWGPWVVQGFYTNERGNTIGPYQPISIPQPPPPPVPEPNDLAQRILDAVRGELVTLQQASAAKPKSTSLRHEAVGGGRVRDAAEAVK